MSLLPHPTDSERPQSRLFHVIGSLRTGAVEYIACYWHDRCIVTDDGECLECVIGAAVRQEVRILTAGTVAHG